MVWPGSKSALGPSAADLRRRGDSRPDFDLLVAFGASLSHVLAPHERSLGAPLAILTIDNHSESVSRSQ